MTPSLALWQFAQGDDSPEVAATVRRALARALDADRVNPLHHCLGIPRTGHAWSLHVRDVYLRRAAMKLPARFTTVRQMALRMREAVPAFFIAAPAWTLYGVPASASEFEKHLFAAWQTGCSAPTTLRQWQTIITGCEAVARNASRNFD